MSGSEGLWVRRYPGRRPPIVALHGFTQTGAMFAELAGMLGNEVLAPDLPGHGHSSEFPTSFWSAAQGVGEVMVALANPAPLMGYSQGGRIALAAALERPELVSHLVLISANAGIEDGSERVERHRTDTTRAALLKSEGVAAFLEQWLNSPMLKGLERRGLDWRAADRAARLENTADGLAEALIGMGQGVQPYLGARLPHLRMPVLVIAGERDQQYALLAATMARSMPHATLRIVRDAGHAVIGEQPGPVADLVGGFLSGSR